MGKFNTSSAKETNLLQLHILIYIFFLACGRAEFNKSSNLIVPRARGIF